MSKIKIKLTSGTEVESNIISAFTVNDNSYVVMENGSVGSMGLPIILVSKYADSKLVKINDQIEWQNVKENLKSIIAGNKINYIVVPNEVVGDDVYFTQLTLPVASFESIKNNYKPEGEVPSISVVPSVEPVAPVVPNVEPVNNMEQAPVTETPSPVVTPTVPETPAVVNNINYNELKESFMKSCENMFDALVNKFQNKD